MFAVGIQYPTRQCGLLLNYFDLLLTHTIHTSAKHYWAFVRLAYFLHSAGLLDSSSTTSRSFKSPQRNLRKMIKQDAIPNVQPKAMKAKLEKTMPHFTAEKFTNYFKKHLRNVLKQVIYNHNICYIPIYSSSEITPSLFLSMSSNVSYNNISYLPCTPTALINLTQLISKQ